MNDHDFRLLVAEKGVDGAYAKLMGRPDWGEALSMLPAHMRGHVVEYICLGRSQGSFMTALVERNLFEACRCADAENLYRLPDYAAFFHNYSPSGCFGSKEKADAWRKAGGAAGLHSQNA